MSFSKGFDFRTSIAYVTDPTNCTYEAHDAPDTYPTTRNGVTFGWVTTTIEDSRDRDNTAGNEKVAGVAFTSSATYTFQVDLPASGIYNISLGVGDVTSSGAVGQVLIKDGGTTLITIAHNGTTRIYDANDTAFTTLAGWVSGQASKQVTFTGTTLSLILSPGGDAFGMIAHLFVDQAAAVGDLSAFPGEPQTGSSKIQGGLR